LPKLLIVTDSQDIADGLGRSLAEGGFSVTLASGVEGVLDRIEDEAPDAIVLELGYAPPDSAVWRLPRRVKEARNVPVLALVPPQAMSLLDPSLPLDDFVTVPCDPSEVLLRLRRALWRRQGVGRGELIDCGDLVIDVDNCEVNVDGRPVTLTFKEYELLKYLASNKGRVFTREQLLSEVWGYDYFGGDRTVDVHVRRLRSKIEDAERTFVETVRNIGYRFKKDQPAPRSGPST
jgi:two-component system alkaline phosphatase synthesis response regulator PhoP